MNRHLLPAAALVLSTAAAIAAPPRSPQAFVAALYAEYARPDASGPLTDANAVRIFTPRLAAAIHADQTAHPGEVGKLDHDPICDCQDFDGLHLDHLSIPTATPTTAIALATFHLGATTRTVRLFLVRTPTTWQVDNVSAPYMPSLRRLLAIR